MFRSASALSLVLILLLTGCAHQPLEPGPVTTGEVAGQLVSLPLDDAKARYYLRDYPEPHPQGWQDWLSEAEARVASEPLGPELLQSLMAEGASLDLTSLLFIHGVLSDEGNRYWQECLFRLSGEINRGELDREAILPDAHQDFVVLLAPGWLYKDHPQTEADFSRTRRTLDALGVNYHFIANPQDGSVEENAEGIAQAVREWGEGDQSLILVSASKSAAEVHWALGELLTAEEAAPVAAWINAGGVVSGTPLADRWTQFPRSLMSRSAFLWYGWSFDSLRSMRTDQSRARIDRASLPETLFILNYVAVPMKAQVTPAAQRRHAYLARYGPSDALAPLWKTKVAGGMTLVEPGADHYFLTVDIGLRTLVMTAMTLNRLQDKGCPSQS